MFYTSVNLIFLYYHTHSHIYISAHELITEFCQSSNILEVQIFVNIKCAPSKNVNVIFFLLKIIFGLGLVINRDARKR